MCHYYLLMLCHLKSLQIGCSWHFRTSENACAFYKFYKWSTWWNKNGSSWSSMCNASSCQFRASKKVGIQNLSYIFWTWEIYSVSSLLLCYGLIFISFINNYNVVYEWFGTFLQLEFYYNILSHLLELLECAFANFEVLQFAH